MSLVYLLPFPPYIILCAQLFVASATRICIFLNSRNIRYTISVIIFDILEDFYMSMVTAGFKPSAPPGCNLICVT